MRTPHRCPVCYGKGLVPAGFYETTPTYTSGAIAGPPVCRACQGAGVLWEPQPVQPVTFTSGGIWSGGTGAQGDGA